MRYAVILIMIFSTVVSGQESELSKIRNLYQRAPERETAAKELLKITEDYRKEDPVLFAYKGAAHMMMAKHVINPFTKMSHFNKGKKIYSVAIEADPVNMELRFLRYSVQSEAPGFLGYKQNVEEDKTLLLKNAKQLRDPGLKKMILEYLLSSDGLSSAEKEKLK